MAVPNDQPVLFELPPVFKVDAVVGQGAYGAVCRATLEKGGHVATVAIKKIPGYAKSGDTAKRVLREVLILRHFQCVRQIVPTHMIFRPLSAEKDLYVVMDYVPSDISTFLKTSHQTTEGLVQYMVAQLLLGMVGMHKCGCAHRDLSTRNVLLNERSEVAIADFGLARFFDPEERMSFGVVTQWYRAPEVVTDAQYDAKVDVWSCGVIMCELFMGSHIFPGKPNDLADQLTKIMRIVGVPDKNLFTKPGATLSTSSDNAKRYVLRVCNGSNPYKRTLFETGGPRFKLEPSAAAKDLLLQLLTFDPDQRPSAREALAHPWFESLRPYITENLKEIDAEVQPFKDTSLLGLQTTGGTATATGGVGEATDSLVAKIEELCPVWNAELDAAAAEIAAALAGEGEEGDDEDAPKAAA